MSNLNTEEYMERITELKIEGLRFKLVAYHEDDPDTILAQANDSDMDQVIAKAQTVENKACEQLANQAQDDVLNGSYQ